MKTVLILLFAWTVSARDPDPCKRQFGSCACETSKGWINLKPLDSNNTATPTFTDIYDPNYDMFSYNPCSNFSYKCTNVAVCQDHYSQYFPVGDQKSATFSTSGDVTITYKSTGNDGIERTSIVKLMCDKSQDGLLVANGEQGSATFYFTLTTKWACPGIAPAPEGAGSEEGAGSGGISARFVLLLISARFVLLIISFSVVYLLYKYCRGSQGKDLGQNVFARTALPHQASAAEKQRDLPEPHYK